MKRRISITLTILGLLLSLGMLRLWASASTPGRLVPVLHGSAPISGKTAVVGAPFDEGAAGANQGSAYVFVRGGGDRSERQKLLALDSAEIVFTSAIALGQGSRPFIVALQGRANPTPTEDPCVLVNTEAATGSALGIGQIAWASREVVNLCSNADGAEVKAEFAITAANGDQLFGVYQTLAKLDFESNEITAHGRYRIMGGTGKFNGASGEGIIGAAGSLAPPFEFRGFLLGRVSF